MNLEEEILPEDFGDFDLDNGSSVKGKDALGIFLDGIRRYPSLSKERNDELLREYHSADKDGKSAIMKQLIEGNLKLITKEAFRIANTFRTKDSKINNGLVLDFIQEGSHGLARAVEKFDLSKGFAFSTFAIAYIKSAILTFINDDYRMIRIPKQISDKYRKIRDAEKSLCNQLHRNPSFQEIAVMLNDGTTADDVENIKNINSSDYVISMDQKRNDEEGENNLYQEIPTSEQNPQEYAESKEMHERLKNAMSLLSDTERFVIEHCYPEDGSDPWTLQSIGDELHFSAERVRQIREKAKTKLLKAMM